MRSGAEPDDITADCTRLIKTPNSEIPNIVSAGSLFDSGVFETRHLSVQVAAQEVSAPQICRLHDGKITGGGVNDNIFLMTNGGD